MQDQSPVALISGAARGIGAGIAARLRQQGWRVVTADLDPGDSGTRHVIADVADEAAVIALLDGVAAREARLDALVCNAGIMLRKPLAELSLAEWNKVLGTNLTSAFLLARQAAPLLKAARGSIVAIASTRAHMSEPDTESYSASKGGILALTHALAVSLGPEVRANCVSPGWIDVAGEELRPEDHAQHPAGRVGRVEDIAALVAWLVGPESGFVTGSEFVSDGGMTRKMIYAG
ncbi:SDR family oxidoreductase [Teichococcus oryzae]|uniref:SDR family oxidoreductase n=1 Tax=Teichococcus oryzae TaxID=1608942 RepID=A0A5B2TDE1_9PROT|nr:SDR family oxidoreductase [Pseudoroseomonas oryzae]KAA2211878.1 SDR family oxidoreductase [Pseudoroseomonas oryzae]